MSGIAGLYHRAPAAAEADDAALMIGAMPHRCRDGSRSVAVGPVALAHGALHTLPEDAAEAIPFAVGRSTITADVRLDNRDELLGLLNDDALTRACSDARIIAHAYSRWGEACVERFVGDFSFALWDAERHALFCARDHFGSKPFCYHAGDALFAFGSEPKAILALAQVPHEIDDEYVGLHFYPDLMVDDKQITFYRAIRRLEPAHCMTVTSDSVTTRCYWRLDPDHDLDLDDESAARRFRELFSDAVDARLRTHAVVASTMSGGLDSSSIAVTARDLLRERGAAPLRTYSALFDDVPSADERQWMNPVTAAGGTDPRVVHPDAESPLVDLDTLLWLHDGPFYGTNYFIHWHIYRSAAADGVRVLLDGEDGDTTVSHGIDRLIELVQQERWQEFFAESDAVVRKFANEGSYASRESMLRGYALPYLHYLGRERAWRSFFRAVAELHHHYGVSRAALIVTHGLSQVRGAGRVLRIARRVARVARRLLPRRRTAAAATDPRVVPRELERTYRLEERLRRLYRKRLLPTFPAHPRSHHVAALTSGALVHGLEVFERMAAYWGIELRHPFCDPRFAAFCLSVPPRLKLRNGESRFIFRTAMEGTLPDEVRLRGGKGDLSDVSYRGLLHFDRATLRDALDQLAAVPRAYLDPAAAVQMIQQLIDGEDARSVTDAWLVFTFIRWFTQPHDSPPVHPFHD